VKGEAEHVSITMPITKWNYQVTAASEIPGAIARAFYIARSGRPGPVLIDIAKNAQVEMFDYAYKPCLSLRSYNPRPALDMTTIEKAVEMINAAERPIMLVGQGVKLGEAEAETIRLAETGNIPMGTTLMGISAVASDHPLFVGNLGMHGNLAANEMSQRSDLIIAVGMRFSDRVTGDVKSYAPNAKIIHIDIDAAEQGKNLRVDLPIHADARDAMEAMMVGLQYKERPEWFALAAAQREIEHADVISKSVAPAGEYITMAGVIQTLAEVENGNAVIVTDVGQNQMFAARYSRFNASRSFITSGGLGTMGFGLPAAIGAKLGAPDREVVAVLGDGGFQMNIQELGTIMQNNIGVKMLVLNNSYLGMVRQWQQLFFNRRYSFTELEDPDFAAVAAAYRIPGKRVERIEDLRPALERMAAAEGSYLLEVVVKGEENVFPMVPAGASLSDFITCEP
jgi:acetolactate synthase-1/2/3 large subunit